MAFTLLLGECSWRIGRDAGHTMPRVTRCWLCYRRLRLKRGAGVVGHYCIYYVEYCVGSSDVAASARPGQNTRAGFIDVVAFYCVVVACRTAAIIQVNARFGAAVHCVASRRIPVTAQIDSIKQFCPDNPISRNGGAVSQESLAGTFSYDSELRVSNHVVRDSDAGGSKYKDAHSGIPIVAAQRIDILDGYVIGDLSRCAKANLDSIFPGGCSCTGARHRII